jgi:hypothetical protein
VALLPGLAQPLQNPALRRGREVTQGLPGRRAAQPRRQSADLGADLLQVRLITQDDEDGDLLVGLGGSYALLELGRETACLNGEGR